MRNKAERAMQTEMLEHLVSEVRDLRTLVENVQSLLLHARTSNPVDSPPPPADDDEWQWLTVNEVADLINRTTVTVRAMCKDGRLTPVRKINKRGDWRIHQHAISDLT